MTRFAAVLGMGPLPQPGAALVVRRVYEDGRIELAPADQTDLAVAQKDLELARQELIPAKADRAELVDLVRRALPWLEELELGAAAGMLSAEERDTVKALADDVNAALRLLS